MIVSQDDNKNQSAGKERSLKEAVWRARLLQADRSDVIVELRASEQARLDLLLEELRPVFEEAPDVEQFGGSLVPGDPPRLWIDIVTYVVMGIDKRTYRFMKDTRQGRRVLHETQDVNDIADKITDYLAHRIIEREMALAGDADRAREQAIPHAPLPEAPAGSMPLIFSFLSGVITGMILLFVYGAFLAAG